MEPLGKALQETKVSGLGFRAYGLLGGSWDFESEVISYKNVKWGYKYLKVLWSQCPSYNVP